MDILSAGTELPIHCVLSDEEGIQGELRIPTTRVLLTRENIENPTITIHVEGGVKYKFDVSSCMFSSGNVNERMHFGSIKALDEIVVDMFAGIGYFSIPLALHAGVRHVYSLEKNPNSVQFLNENIILNGIQDRVTVFCGDNREVGNEILGTANRVLMGYIPTPKQFIARAIQFINPERNAIIHYHYNCKKNEIQQIPNLHFEEELSKIGLWSFKVADTRIIKSYSPQIYHCTADILVKKQI